MGKNKGNKEAAAVAAPTQIEAEPGFFGHVLKPGQSLVWENETEELALQLTTAALGPKVSPGRSTLFAEAKDSKIALCTLVPEKTEQWNMTHIFTAFDGPVQFHNEGVNEIHLTGLIDIQDDEEDEEHGHDHDGCEDHDHDDDSDDEEGMPMDGTYSDSDDDEVMVFGGDDDDDSEDDDSEEDEDDEGRFEVLEERVHGDAGEKKQKKETPKKKDAKKDEKKETPKKEATPAKKEKKEATPAKKEEKKEATPTKKEDASKKATEATNSKKRPASAEAVEVPKKAKTTTRVHKGVTIEEVAIGKGQPVGRGKKVSILYRGRLLNGKQFDANQNRKSPFTFRHGVGDVIKGMDIGIEGMRAGGKRTITIPSHLGYGKSGAGASIPGNSTLIFEIELL